MDGWIADRLVGIIRKTKDKQGFDVGCINRAEIERERDACGSRRITGDCGREIDVEVVSGGLGTWAGPEDAGNFVYLNWPTHDGLQLKGKARGGTTTAAPGGRSFLLRRVSLQPR